MFSTATSVRQPNALPNATRVTPRDNNAMKRSHENLAVTISADWRSPIISATIYLRVARRGSIIADVITLK